MPFNITEERLTAFVDEWYLFFEEYRGRIQSHAFVLDKRYYRNKRNIHSPLHILAQVLFDRVEKHPSKETVIVFDQMDKEISSEKNLQGGILKIADKAININSYFKAYTHVRPRFEKSCNSNLLQMADIVAYDVYRQFVDHGDKWDGKDGTTLPLYEYLKRIIGTFYCSTEGRLAGYGLVKIPDPSKTRWRMPEKKQ